MSKYKLGTEIVMTGGLYTGTRAVIAGIYKDDPEHYLFCGENMPKWCNGYTAANSVPMLCSEHLPVDRSLWYAQGREDMFYVFGGKRYISAKLVEAYSS